MIWVYVIRSVDKPGRRYVGLSGDLSRRLAEHDAGRVKATARDRPWDLVAAFLFPDPERANAFEAFLRSQEGKSFGKEHLWDD